MFPWEGPHVPPGRVALGRRECGRRAGFPSVLRIGWTPCGNSTENGQSVFLPIPSPRVLGSQCFQDKPGEDRANSSCLWVMCSVSLLWL